MIIPNVFTYIISRNISQDKVTCGVEHYEYIQFVARYGVQKQYIWVNTAVCDILILDR